MKRQRSHSESKPRASPRLPSSSATNRQEDERNNDSNNQKQQEEHENQEEEDEDEDEILLTPHTLRLLKLIQEGSQEHASMAALQLSHITAQSSPLVLWDVLGRLLSSLADPMWQTRHNASGAMQGVARHLPPHSRRQFLEDALLQQQQQEKEQPSSENENQSRRKDNFNDSYLWLTLEDVQRELPAILGRGRLLWAFSDQQQQDKEGQYLHQLDQQQLQAANYNNNNNNDNDNHSSSSDFVQRRIQWQRRILAQRVGLSGLMQATGGSADIMSTCFSDTITSEDLLPLPSATTTIPSNTSAVKSTTAADPTQKKQRRTRSGHKKESPKSKKKDVQNNQYQHNTTMRALLVMEMKREQASSNNNHLALSHTNPQTLLATELLYRVFDPVWHVRHGALLGMLSLLRAWHRNNNNTSHKPSSFGAWPQDILARCICVLVLDRFGDYSGTTIPATREDESSSSSSFKSGGVVAPVRETAAQLLSMVWLLAPVTTQDQTLQLLYHLAAASSSNNSRTTDFDPFASSSFSHQHEQHDKRNDDWEIRHGALLALKYIGAVLVSLSEKQEQEQQCVEESSRLSNIGKVAMQMLGDDSDDVQSVAAQILTTIVSSNSTSSSSASNKQSIVQETFGFLWQALKQMRSVSSSIMDVMGLCSALLRHCDDPPLGILSAWNNTPQSLTPPPLKGSDVLDILRTYLDHDLVSVRIAVLQSIANVVEPIWKATFDSLLSNSPKEDDGSDVLLALDQLCGRVMDTYFLDPASNTFWAREKTQRKSRRTNGSDEVDDTLIDSEAAEDFQLHRDVAWNRLAIVLHHARFHGYQTERWFQSTAKRLILRYFGILMSPSGGLSSGRLYHPDVGSGSSFRFMSHGLYPCHLRAAKALSQIWFPDEHVSIATSPTPCGEEHNDVLELSFLCFLQSPWTSQCEAACLLYRALVEAFPDNSKKSARGGINATVGALQQILQTCRQSITARLQGEGGDVAPLCLALDCNEKGKEVVRDRDIAQLCDTSFVSAYEMQGKTALACDIIASWRKTIQSKVSDGEIVFSTSVSEVSTTLVAMRFWATMAGASVASTAGTLPLQKVTPIIRPLMTSLKNETDTCRRDQTCKIMVGLLSSAFSHEKLSDNGSVSPFSRAREKILNSICEVISDGSGKSTAEHQAYTQVIQSLVAGISQKYDSLEQVTPVWLRLLPLMQLSDNPRRGDEGEIQISRALNLLQVVCGKLPPDKSLTSRVAKAFLPPLVGLACRYDDLVIRDRSCAVIQSLCCIHARSSLSSVLPAIISYLDDRGNDTYRLAGCQLLRDIVNEVGMEICPFVSQLLRRVMSLMADPLPSCSKIANSVFARLVRVAPLVRHKDAVFWDTEVQNTNNSNAVSVMDHLIHGKPLPSYSLPDTIKNALNKNNISLRPYQMEGIAWLRFLQTVNLNGALCDQMGLGKTLQALIGVAIAHCEIANESNRAKPRSLVVCPSSVVGHWVAEIDKFFPGKSIFRTLAYAGNSDERKSMWRQSFASCNIVVTSYAALRTDVEILAKPLWCFCVLDEGHLLKNPKTSTARASRRIRAQHKLILTGTPVQNRVQEIFATFDFLMPNFLGTSASFAKEFARPILKGHLPGASAEGINAGLEKLKVLHQQVLPFILRREKSQVLKELPPKCISHIPCEMSTFQRALYDGFCSSREAKRSVAELQAALQQSTTSETNEAQDDNLNIGSDALKSLLFLRLLCTHPALVENRTSLNLDSMHGHVYDIDKSGKFMALAELLRACGIHKDEITGADNDTSLLYCNQDEEDDNEDNNNSLSNLLEPVESDASCQNISEKDSGSKCLLFAQFTQSLDAVEEYLLKRHMPSLRYLRLDGRVPANKRTALVDAFNTDPSIKLMLLTTRVGGLGLNLTGADTVVFLESDYNPFSDLQAADRAHRIGQDKTVNVYRLVTTDSIEEKIMTLQEKKIAISNAIVNTDNSTMFSMGTDRLLDIFTCRSNSHNQQGKKEEQESGGYDLDALVERYKDDYASLSVNDFVKALQK